MPFLGRGLTLVEMLVVLAIVSILSAVLINTQTSFNKSNLLTDAAYTVALSVRESETLGLSSRAFTGSTNNNVPYGVHFGDSTTYYDQFADITPLVGINTANCPHSAADAGTPAARPGDCYEDNTTEQVRRYTFNQGFTISKICGSTNGGTSYGTCSAPGAGNTLDIIYERSNTQAIITFNQATSLYNTAAIDITSPQGGTRCVIATQLGEISVSSTCP